MSLGMASGNLLGGQVISAPMFEASTVLRLPAAGFFALLRFHLRGQKVGEAPEI